MNKLLFFLLLWGAGLTRAATFSTDGSVASVQAAINSAPEGSVITLPAGTFNWGNSIGSVFISGKGLTLQGSGNTTIIANGPKNSFSGVLQINTAGSSVPTRITGIYFNGGWSVGTNGKPGDPVYRIDNCTFDGNNSTEGVSPVMLSLFGGGWGLIDHCTFTAGGAAEMLHDNAYGFGNNPGWLNDVNPGTYKFVYLENDTFICTASTPYNTGCGATYGSQDVIRYCNFQFSKLDRHGDSTNLTSVGTRWYEVYNDNFNAEGNNQDAYMDLRDGSGVVFNITVSGSNAGAGYLKVDEDLRTASYPTIWQIGQGLGTPSTNNSPLYFWGLGSLTGNVGSSSNAIVSGQSYIVVNSPVGSAPPSNMKIRQRASDGLGSTYNYTPFTYPYPLDANGLPNPAGTGVMPIPTPVPATTPTPTPIPISFAIGGQVGTLYSVCNVRASAAGTLLGTQSQGTIGTIVDGPIPAALPGSPVINWWSITFPSGVSGWVGENALATVPTPTPTPTPNATPTPTPTPTPVPSPTPSPTPSATPSPTATPIPSVSPTVSPTPLPTSTPTPSATATPSPAVTPVPTYNTWEAKLQSWLNLNPPTAD